MLKRGFRTGLALLAACALALPLAAEAQTEVSFYYPVAVGGPITKIIDGFAADFEKENPGVKLETDLFGQLPGIDYQGADRREER
jgi:sn-glycerol 3-phosphate transport system substrate-binding protein